ncbi:MAG TPA: exonuclease domain-containing protein [Candidatus Saccharimonadales bacterium]|nr:exonuclease domain-containing protein [Candidatus Saccharimonadales bacterium]
MSVLDQPLVFVDIETNGLNHIRGRVVEVAAIRVEQGEIVREFRSLIDPVASLPRFITNLTGIRQEDVAGQPLFAAVADELHDILDGAVFVAHNVRFDYSFLKQEFKRVGKSFCPRQLCTMRLSRALFPEQRSHKLQTLIERHQLQVSARHRAYDDAHALWQFLQRVQQDIPADALGQAIAAQVKQPSLPKALSPDVITTLPTGPGVYIMYDQSDAPLYVGKSIHIRQRVAEHFMRDHDNVSEFKLSQRVHRITAHETNGELEALLLESQLVKELLPYQNKLLRRTNTLVLAMKEQDADGYLHVRSSVVSPDDIASTADVLAVYDRRSKLRTSLETAAKEWDLCPKLLGLEKTDRACFWMQLGKCKGACAGKEAPEAYNARLQLAFMNQRLQPWPYHGPIIIEESAAQDMPQEQENATATGLVVDRWCVVGKLRQDMDCEPVLERKRTGFDLDAYRILKAYLAAKRDKLTIRALTPQQAASLGLA